MIHLTMLTLQHMERVPYITPTLKWYKYPNPSPIPNPECECPCSK